jgi:DnaK suppressor protein
METWQFEKYAAMLRRKEVELIAGLNNRDGLTAEPEPDFFDEIQKAAEQAFLIENLDRGSALLRAVRAALARIADGSYGECQRCGEEIQPKRLAAVPWAAFCLPCQERADLECVANTEDALLAPAR